MNKKQFRIKPEGILELVPAFGGCYATDRITVDGDKVGYMYREDPDFKNDSGWRFFCGTETQEYMDNPNHTEIYNVNTIANYDRAIIPYLNFPVGTELEREENTSEFIAVTD